MALKPILVKPSEKSLNTNRLECAICKERFWLTCKYMDHMATHKHFTLTCNICNKGFFDQKHLDEHYLTHTGVINTYNCKECPKKFLQKYQLEQHIQSHEPMLNEPMAKKRKSVHINNIMEIKSANDFSVGVDDDHDFNLKDDGFDDDNDSLSDEEDTDFSDFDDYNPANKIAKTRSGRVVRARRLFDDGPEVKCKPQKFKTVFAEESVVYKNNKTNESPVAENINMALKNISINKPYVLLKKIPQSTYEKYIKEGNNCTYDKPNSNNKELQSPAPIVPSDMNKNMLKSPVINQDNIQHLEKIQSSSIKKPDKCIDDISANSFITKASKLTICNKGFIKNLPDKTAVNSKSIQNKFSIVNSPLPIAHIKPISEKNKSVFVIKSPIVYNRLNRLNIISKMNIPATNENYKSPNEKAKGVNGNLVFMHNSSKSVQNKPSSPNSQLPSEHAKLLREKPENSANNKSVSSNVTPSAKSVKILHISTPLPVGHVKPLCEKIKDTAGNKNVSNSETLGSSQPFQNSILSTDTPLSVGHFRPVSGNIASNKNISNNNISASSRPAQNDILSTSTPLPVGHVKPLCEKTKDTADNKNISNNKTPASSQSVQNNILSTNTPVSVRHFWPFSGNIASNKNISSNKVSASPQLIQNSILSTSSTLPVGHVKPYCGTPRNTVGSFTASPPVRSYFTHSVNDKHFMYVGYNPNMNQIKDVIAKVSNISEQGKLEAKFSEKIPGLSSQNTSLSNSQSFNHNIKNSSSVSTKVSPTFVGTVPIESRQIDPRTGLNINPGKYLKKSDVKTPSEEGILEKVVIQDYVIVRVTPEYMSKIKRQQQEQSYRLATQYSQMLNKSESQVKNTNASPTSSCSNKRKTAFHENEMNAKKLHKDQMSHNCQPLVGHGNAANDVNTGQTVKTHEKDNQQLKTPLVDCQSVTSDHNNEPPFDVNSEKMKTPENKCQDSNLETQVGDCQSVTSDHNNEPSFDVNSEKMKTPENKCQDSNLETQVGDCQSVTSDHNNEPSFDVNSEKMKTPENKCQDSNLETQVGDCQSVAGNKCLDNDQLKTQVASFRPLIRDNNASFDIRGRKIKANGNKCNRNKTGKIPVAGRQLFTIDNASFDVNKGEKIKTFENKCKEQHKTPVSDCQTLIKDNNASCDINKGKKIKAYENKCNKNKGQKILVADPQSLTIDNNAFDVDKGKKIKTFEHKCKEQQKNLAANQPLTSDDDTLFDANKGNKVKMYENKCKDNQQLKTPVCNTKDEKHITSKSNSEKLLAINAKLLERYKAKLLEKEHKKKEKYVFKKKLRYLEKYLLEENKKSSKKDIKGNDKDTLSCQEFSFTDIIKLSEKFPTDRKIKIGESNKTMLSKESMRMISSLSKKFNANELYSDMLVMSEDASTSCSSNPKDCIDPSLQDSESCKESTNVVLSASKKLSDKHLQSDVSDITVGVSTTCSKSPKDCIKPSSQEFAPHSSNVVTADSEVSSRSKDAGSTSAIENARSLCLKFNKNLNVKEYLKLLNELDDVVTNFNIGDKCPFLLPVLRFCHLFVDSYEVKERAISLGTKIKKGMSNCVSSCSVCK